MTRLLVFTSLVGCLFVSAAGAQPEPVRVPVRPVAEVSTWERVQIALTRALIPGAKVIAPLYAYDIALACDERYADERRAIGEHEGSAALVDIGAGAVASYYPTAAEAVAAARDLDVCDSGAEWQFATTTPLEVGVVEEGRYITRQVEQVEAALAEPNGR